MSKKTGKDEPHITRISASHSRPEKSEKTAKPAPIAEKAKRTDQPAAKPEKTEQNSHTTPVRPEHASKPAKKASKRKENKPEKAEKPLKEVFILTRPFVRFGRYLRDSWRELRQVRWPNRKAAWKMTFAVFAYCAILMVFILLLDTLFTFLFSLLLQK